MSEHSRTVHLILNPAAGRGGAGRQLRRILRALHEDGYTVQEYVTARPMHAATIARALPADGAPLCVAGGDGTLNEVINGLPPGTHPIGILPFGTGNDFARALRIHSMRDTLNALLRDSRRKVDAATADVLDEDENVIVRRYVNALGIGFDAAVALDVSQRRFGTGILPYLLAVFRVLRQYSSVPSTTIMQNREMSVSLFLACIGNGTTSGGGFRLTPKALVDDGLLDLCHVRDVSVARVLQVLPRALNGSHIRAPEVTYVQGAHIDVALDYPLPVHVDGEIVSERARRIIASCLPGAYEFYAPSV
ncbi:MAG: diacylglycerol kinase family lipid kinase [Bacteroidetes bacterium]|nr:diacylglycerol kinase family lipid kinase [Bacteroidota bacterium]